jgi:hypothetical protein
MIKQVLKKVLFYLAATGWVLGLVVHVFSLCGFDVADKIPFVWALHIGIFIVCVPLAINSERNRILNISPQSATSKRRGFDGLFETLQKAPGWLGIIVLIGCFYAMINCIWFVSLPSGMPQIKNGQYVFSDKGQFIKTLTVQEYHQYRAKELRGISGLWLVFYGLAAAALFPYSLGLQPSDAANTHQS